jgi:hypothetical protein
MSYRFLIVTLLLIIASRTALAGNTERHRSLMDSPWPIAHRTLGKQANTPFPGPTEAATAQVQFRDDRIRFRDSLGTSPWLILSEQKYTDSPTARTVWGASLRYVFKFVVDGNRFERVDQFRLSGFPAVSWNLAGRADHKGGHILVPQPTGLRHWRQRRNPCYGRIPAILKFRDGSTTDSSIVCEDKIELVEDRIRRACPVNPNLKMGYSGSFLSLLPNGEIMTNVRFKKRRGRSSKHDQNFLLVINPETHL